MTTAPAPIGAAGVVATADPTLQHVRPSRTSLSDVRGDGHRRRHRAVAEWRPRPGFPDEPVCDMRDRVRRSGAVRGRARRRVSGRLLRQAPLRHRTDRGVVLVAAAAPVRAGRRPQRARRRERRRQVPPPRARGRSESGHRHRAVGERPQARRRRIGPQRRRRRRSRSRRSLRPGDVVAGLRTRPRPTTARRGAGRPARARAAGCCCRSPTSRASRRSGSAATGSISTCRVISCSRRRVPCARCSRSWACDTSRRCPSPPSTGRTA